MNSPFTTVAGSTSPSARLLLLITDEDDFALLLDSIDEEDFADDEEDFSLELNFTCDEDDSTELDDFALLQDLSTSLEMTLEEEPVLSLLLDSGSDTAE